MRSVSVAQHGLHAPDDDRVVFTRAVLVSLA